MQQMNISEVFDNEKKNQASGPAVVAVILAAPLLGLLIFHAPLLHSRITTSRG